MADTLQFRLLHPDDRSVCPGIYECERCMVDAALSGNGLFWIKEPVDGTLARHDD